MSTVAFLALAAVCIAVCAFLRSRLAAAVFASFIFVLLAFVVPLGEIAWKCSNAPTSEACVWGKSLMPISLAVGVVIGLIAAAGVWFLTIGFQKRRRNLSGATESSHALEDGHEQ